MQQLGTVKKTGTFQKTTHMLICLRIFLQKKLYGAIIQSQWRHAWSSQRFISTMDKLSWICRAGIYYGFLLVNVKNYYFLIDSSCRSLALCLKTHWDHDCTYGGAAIKGQYSKSRRTRSRIGHYGYSCWLLQPTRAKGIWPHISWCSSKIIWNWIGWKILSTVQTQETSWFFQGRASPAWSPSTTKPQWTDYCTNQGMTKLFSLSIL